MSASLSPLEVAAKVARLQHAVRKQQELIDAAAEQHTTGVHVELCENSKTAYEDVTALHGALVKIPVADELIVMAKLAEGDMETAPNGTTIKERITPLVVLMDVCTPVDDRLNLGDAIYTLSKRGNAYKNAFVEAGLVPILLRIARECSIRAQDRAVRGATACLVSLTSEFPKGVRLVMEDRVGAQLAHDMLGNATSPDQVRLSMELMRNLASNQHASALQRLGVMPLLVEQACSILGSFPYGSQGHDINTFRDACFNAIHRLCVHDVLAKKEFKADPRCAGVIRSICKLEDADDCYSDVGVALLRSVLQLPHTMGDDEYHKTFAQQFSDAGLLKMLVKWLGSESEDQKNDAARALAWLIRDLPTLTDRAMVKEVMRKALALCTQDSSNRLVVTGLLLLKWLLHKNDAAATRFEEMNGLKCMTTVINKIDPKCPDAHHDSAAAYLSLALAEYAAHHPSAAWSVAKAGFVDKIACFAKADKEFASRSAGTFMVQVASIVAVLPSPAKKRKRPQDDDSSEDEE